MNAIILQRPHAGDRLMLLTTRPSCSSAATKWTMVQSMVLCHFRHKKGRFYNVIRL